MGDSAGTGAEMGAPQGPAVGVGSRALLCEVPTISRGGGKHFYGPLIGLPTFREVGHCGFSVGGE